MENDKDAGFRALVGQMRAAQRHYRRTSVAGWLRETDRLEAKVDAILKGDEPKEPTLLDVIAEEQEAEPQ